MSNPPSSTHVEMPVTPNHGAPLPQVLDPAPAPGGAGGYTAKSRRDELVELTLVSTRLEVLYKMYQRLLKSGSGTGSIESGGYVYRVGEGEWSNRTPSNSE